MGPRFLAGLFVFLLTCHTSYAGILEPLVGCRCARVRATFIPPSKYASVIMYPPGSACNRMEVIITLKEKGTRVCVSPEAKWVQNLVRRIKRTQKSAPAPAKN